MLLRVTLAHREEFPTFKPVAGVIRLVDLGRAEFSLQQLAPLAERVGVRNPTCRRAFHIHATQSDSASRASSREFSMPRTTKASARPPKSRTSGQTAGAEESVHGKSVHRETEKTADLTRATIEAGEVNHRLERPQNRDEGDQGQRQEFFEGHRHTPTFGVGIKSRIGQAGV
jgi:hypothetical protein